jgi:L1 cell adhesion molecule like protein
LSQEEIDRMVKEAEQHAEEDKQSREKLEMKNSLENYLYSIRNTLNDENVKGKISDDDKKLMDEKVQEGIKWLDDNQNATKEDYEEKRKEVESVIMPIMTKMYQQQQNSDPNMQETNSNQENNSSNKGPSVEEVD